MSLHGRQHRIVCSFTNQDAAALETIDANSVLFRLQAGHNTGPSITEYYRDIDETGTETYLEESAPTPVAVEYTKGAQMAGDDTSLAFWSYWATQGAAASSSAQLDTSGVYELIWFGPSTTPQARAFSMGDIGQPSTTDTDFNRDVYNATPERVVISGSRRGLITVAADIRAGRSVGTSTDYSALGNHYRVNIFNFGMTHVFTSTTLGQQSVPGTTWFAEELDTDTEILAATELDGTPVSLTSALMEFSLEMTQGLDLQRSYAPGNLTAANAGYVPASGDWIYDNNGQQIELEMLFRQNDSAGSNVVETLIAESEAGTRRAWELWFVDPDAVGDTSDSHYGFKCTLYQCGPANSFTEENDGFGERYVRARYKAQWHAVDDVGWHFAAGSAMATALGG